MESWHFSHIRHYWEIVSRRKGLILSSILLSITCGLIFFSIQEKVYKGEARLSYQQQKINPYQMSPDEQTEKADIVSRLTQIVTSRSNLEKIILEEDLYANLRKNLKVEDVVEIMRRNINIVQNSEGDTFVIEYLGNSPDKVVRVTNKLASRIIEENLQYPQERTSETFVSPQNELEMSKEILNKKEAVIRDYKHTYYDEMKDQRQMNMSRLAALQGQYKGTQESIKELEQNQILIQDLIDDHKVLVEQEKQQKKIQQASKQDAATTITINKQAKLEMLQNGLAVLQKRYPDQHPQVERLKKQIADLQKLIQEERIVPDNTKPNTTSEFDAELLSLQIRIKDIGALSLKQLEQEKEEIELLIDMYEDWVISASVREAEWSSLTREYGELKKQYEFFVAQHLKDLSALNLEINPKGYQFKIEESAQVRESPIQPNFNKIMVLMTFIGLVAGVLLVLGMEIVDTSFKSQDKLEKTFDLKVICCVPNFALPGETAPKYFWSFSKTVLFLIWISAVCFAMFDLRNEGKIISSFIQIVH